MIIRTFLAIELPEAVKNSLLDSITLFKKQQHSGIKFVDEANLHITIKFLGEQEEKKIADFASLLKKKQLVSDTIAVKMIGGFPDILFPKVLWAGIDQPDRLNKIHQFVEETAANSGFESDAKRFHPHVTLARVKERLTISLTEQLKICRNLSFGQAFRPQEMVLFQSILTSSGPEYKLLEQFPLKES